MLRRCTGRIEETKFALGAVTGGQRRAVRSADESGRTDQSREFIFVLDQIRELE